MEFIKPIPLWASILIYKFKSWSTYLYNLALNSTVL